jgi:hypothetical protein
LSGCAHAPSSTALPKADTKCTAPSLIPRVNGNTVRSFSHGLLSAAPRNIRLVQHLDSSAHGLVRSGCSYLALFPYPLISPSSRCCCGGTTSPPSPLHQVYLKFKCGGAASTSELFVLLYRDPFCATLVATWQVFVHALRRTDMAAVVGQTTQSSVVVRGQPTGGSRRVAVFSSHPDELQVAPDSLLLVGGALTELMLSFRPLVPGRLDALLHVVDTVCALCPLCVSPITVLVKDGGGTCVEIARV